MALSMLNAHPTEDGMAFTLITENGLQPLEGTLDEVETLVSLMRQASVLARAGEPAAEAWLGEARVGDATVRLGLGPDGGRLVVRR